MLTEFYHSITALCPVIMNKMLIVVIKMIWGEKNICILLHNLRQSQRFKDKNKIATNTYINQISKHVYKQLSDVILL